ncbi:MAG TPA: hypothetical protein VGA04_26340 [Streptosporangiaceae bacterium]
MTCSPDDLRGVIGSRAPTSQADAAAVAIVATVLVAVTQALCGLWLGRTLAP